MQTERVKFYLFWDSIDSKEARVTLLCRCAYDLFSLPIWANIGVWKGKQLTSPFAS